MSAVQIQMPRVSETIDESYVVEWAVEIGENVEIGQVLLRVETDKAIVEIPSTVAGLLVKTMAEVDEPVTTGATIAVVEESYSATP